MTPVTPHTQLVQELIDVDLDVDRSLDADALAAADAESAVLLAFNGILGVLTDPKGRLSDAVGNVGLFFNMEQRREDLHQAIRRRGLHLSVAGERPVSEKIASMELAATRSAYLLGVAMGIRFASGVR